MKFIIVVASYQLGRKLNRPCLQERILYGLMNTMMIFIIQPGGSQLIKLQVTQLFQEGTTKKFPDAAMCGTVI